MAAFAIVVFIVIGLGSVAAVGHSESLKSSRSSCGCIVGDGGAGRP